MVRAELAFLGILLAVAWAGLYGYRFGLALGSQQPTDQIRADIYFAGQEEATKACKGEMNYE